MILTKQTAGLARIVAESLVGSILARIHRILMLDPCRRLVGRLQRALAVPSVARPVSRPERMIHWEDRTPVDAMIRARIGRRRRHPPEVGPFNPSTREAVVGGFLSSRIAWATK